MRIISGKYRGLNLKGFDIDGTRPTMDRVKESLFAMIQTKIKNSTCLDLFAGSGALGLEAISNGAKTVYFVDNNNIPINTLKENLKKIDEECVVLKKDYQEALKQLNQKFDIIFLDPPYKMHIINNALKLIKKYDLLNENGIIICEYEDEIINDIYPLYKEKKYGSTYIKILKNE